MKATRALALGLLGAAALAALLPRFDSAQPRGLAVTRPMADEQLRLKLDSIERVAPEVVVASNPGCLLHLMRGATSRGSAVRLAHLVDLLGRAYPPPRRAAAH